MAGPRKISPASCIPEQAKTCLCFWGPPVAEKARKLLEAFAQLPDRLREEHIDAGICRPGMNRDWQRLPRRVSAWNIARELSLLALCLMRTNGPPIVMLYVLSFRRKMKILAHCGRSTRRRNPRCGYRSMRHCPLLKDVAGLVVATTRVSISTAPRARVLNDSQLHARFVAGCSSSLLASAGKKSGVRNGSFVRPPDVRRASPSASRPRPVE